MSNTATKERKCELSQLQSGDKLSMTYYLTVIKKDRDSIDVRDQNGLEFSIRGKELIEETINSANQFNETKNLSRTEAIEILESAGDTVFTTNFNKLPNEDSFTALLSTVTIGELNDVKKLKKLAKEAMKGEERTLTGHLVNSEPKMGRTTVVDLNIPLGQHNLRQVDHRTINWIIFKNIKYVVK